jgi:hypothetical protein
MSDIKEMTDQEIKEAKKEPENGHGKISNWTDWVLNKVVPKKFVVFVLATIGWFSGMLDGNTWGYIAMIYIGGNVLQKFAEIVKKK